MFCIVRKRMRDNVYVIEFEIALTYYFDIRGHK